MRKAAESQGLKLARQLAIIRERARADREALEASQGNKGFLPLTSMVEPHAVRLIKRKIWVAIVNSSLRNCHPCQLDGAHSQQNRRHGS